MAMKIFFTVAGFAGFAAGLYFMTRDVKPEADYDRVVAIAWGAATQDQVEMELPVTDLMIAKDPMGPGSPWANAHEWSEDHLKVFDSSGKKQKWQRRGMARHTKGPAAGISDGFLIFRLKPGDTYTLKYTPNIAAGISYSTEFIASTDAESRQQMLNLPRL